uniref:Putative RING-H2 finger protein n=1 Tax=Clandestinovirus TaxID=2831644 RepID=A0A8F8KR12_9VIRU|nr:putative RING-H2 finger protein [Clandestinovirus]
MEQLNVFINEAFRDLLNERGVDVSNLPQVFARLAGYIKYGVFLWRDISSPREVAWENIRSWLTADCISQQVPEAHRGSLMSFVQFAFDQVSNRCNEADGRAFAEGSRMPMDVVFGSDEEDSDESDIDIEDGFNQPGPIRILPGADLRSVLTRLVYQQTLRRFMQEASQFQDRDDGVEQSVIDSFPRFQYSATSTENGEAIPTTETTCVVCQDDFVEGANCLRIPTCQHFFHEDCITPWLARRQTCPTCREPCVEGMSVEEDVSEDSYSDSEYDD